MRSFSARSLLTAFDVRVTAAHCTGQPCVQTQAVATLNCGLALCIRYTLGDVDLIDRCLVSVQAYKTDALYWYPNPPQTNPPIWKLKQQRDAAMGKN